MMSSEEEEAEAYDFFKVTVRDGSGALLKLLETVDNRAEQDVWKSSNFDLREFAGRTILVLFQVTTDDSNSTSFYLDDVELQVCSGVQPTPAARPTPTPTIGPAASGCQDVLLNGGFESGDFADWDSGNMWTMAEYEPEITSDVAHAGEFSAWLGGYSDASDIVLQSVVIPTQVRRAMLSFWWMMETEEEEHPYDFMTVKILDADGEELATLLELSDGDRADEWSFYYLDLSRYAGREVQMSFEVTGDENNITSFYLDDVRVEVCGGVLPAGRHRIFLPIVLRAYGR
jgi:hypothetical protein